MRILVTGISGFAGSHLVEALQARPGVRVVGISRRAPLPSLAGQVDAHFCDLCDGKGLEAIVRAVQPEQVFHLAGFSHAGESLKNPDGAWAGNLQATRCLYESIARWGGKPRILYVGSGLVYGDAEAADHAQDECTPLRPVSPYAASKAAADLASYQYTRTAGLEIVRVRPFNHIGPRQSPQYAVAHFAQQIAAIESGRQAPLLETGNLSPRRDFTDVRDMVQAYLLLMDRGRSGEVYNVGTGVANSMQGILDQLLGLAKVPIEVRQKPGLVRSAETSVVRADAGKIRREVGWQPRISLAQTLEDVLAFWRKSVLSQTS